MSIMGSALARGLAGAGGGAAAIANRYIDAELQQQHARLLADLRVQSAKAIDEYELSPERQGRLRDIESQSIMGRAKATRDAEQAGYEDAGYQGARRKHLDTEADDATGRSIKGKTRELKELAPAEVEAANTRTRGTMDAEAERAGKIADATYKAQAKHRAPTSGQLTAGLKLPPAIKEQVDALDKQEERITTEMTKVMASGGGQWNPAKFPEQAQLQEEIAALRMQRDRLLAPYMGKGGIDADPFGIRGSLTPPEQANKDKTPVDKPLPKRVPMQQAGIGGGIMDRIKGAMTSRDEGGGPLAGASERTLRQIAGIEGHTMQAEAKAELERRRAQPVDTGGVGFGGMAAP